MPTSSLEYKRAWCKANTGRIRETRKAWDKANRTKVLAHHKTWRQNHPEAKRARDHARRAREYGTVGKYTKLDLHRIMEEQGISCYCGISFLVVDPTIDHIIPLFRGGTNWPDNLQFLCQPCNDSKGTKLMSEWKKDK